MEKVIVEVEKYKSFDGKVFSTEKECDHHEKMKNGERKRCDSCDGVGKSDPYGDGRSFTTCYKCSGKGWVEKQTVWK